MEHILYWLWLTTKFRTANAKITRLFKHFDSIEDIYSSKSYNNINGIEEKEKKLLEDKDLEKAEDILEKIADIGGKIIVYDDENYPNLLKNIADPPYVLYVLGKVPELDEVLTIGVVGTRRSSEYGNVVTDRVCRDLAEVGVVTISGLAYGIDAVSAWATIEQGGIAVGVLGCGPDIVYPRENADLYQAMTEKGCIITEFPPGTPPLGANFPVRNRIIAGLSRGVLVTEAPIASGALITARYAIDNGRDVFAIPGKITDKSFAGTNLLIQQGAKLVTDTNDILEEYPYAVSIQQEKEQKEESKSATANEKVKITDNSEKYKNLNDNEKKIIAILRKSDMQIDELSRAVDSSVGDVNTRLIMLEVKGLIKRLPGGRYQLNI